MTHTVPAPSATRFHSPSLTLTTPVTVVAETFYRVLKTDQAQDERRSVADASHATVRTLRTARPDRPDLVGTTVTTAPDRRTNRGNATNLRPKRDDAIWDAAETPRSQRFEMPSPLKPYMLLLL
jgi:hypothetical protein